MPRPRKITTTENPKPYKVAKPDTVHDGKGGFFAVGEPIDPPAESVEALLAKGLITLG